MVEYNSTPNDPSSLGLETGIRPDDSETGSGLSLREIQNRAMSGSVWTVIHTVVSVPLAFIANILVARALGPSSYGDLTVLVMALGLIGIATNAGISNGVIQWGAAADAAGFPRRTDGLLEKSLGWRLCVQLPLMALSVLFLSWGKGWLIQTALLVSVLFPALFGGAALTISVENRTAVAAKLTMTTNVLVLATVVWVASTSHDALSVWAARLTILGLLAPLDFLIIGKHRRGVSVRPRLPLRMPAGFWRFGLFEAASGLLSLLALSRSEVFVLQLLGTSSSVGLFAIAYGLAGHITAPVDALLGPLIPATAGLIATAPHRAKEALLRATRFTALLCGGVTAVVLPVLVVAIPRLYGSSFAGAALVVVPLGISSCFVSVLNPVRVMLRARRLAGNMFKATVLALLVDIAIALSTVPFVGIWGAVLAKVGATVVINVAFVRMEVRASGMTVRELVGASRAWTLSLFPLGIALIGAVLLVHEVGARIGIALFLGGFAYVVAVRLSRSGLSDADRLAVEAVLPRILRAPAKVVFDLFGDAG